MGRRLGSLLRVLFAVVVCVAIVEGTARIGVRRILGRPPLHQFDPDLGWVLRPDTKAQVRTRAGEWITVETNARGDRSPALDPERTGPRLLILGDSNLFGVGVESAARFDAALRGPGSPVAPLEVVNAAVSGWSADQALRRLQRDGAALAPDVVLFAVHENDLGQLRRDRHSGYWKPRFRLNDAGALELAPVRGSRWVSRLRRSSDLVGLVATILSSGAQDLVEDRAAEIALLDAIVAEAAATADRLGARFVLALQSRTALRADAPEDWKAPLLARALRERRPLIDLDRVLDDALRSGPVFLEADALHWSPRGHAAVGAAIAPVVDAALAAPRSSAGAGA